MSLPQPPGFGKQQAGPVDVEKPIVLLEPSEDLPQFVLCWNRVGDGCKLGDLRGREWSEGGV